MIIKSLHIKNFRSIFDERIECGNLTVLVGRNGAGKSSFLRALEIFYDPRATATPEDYYDRDTSQEIEIAATFTDLSPEAVSLFRHYLDGSDLTVCRVFSMSGAKSGTYHGARLQNPEFAQVRSAGGRREITAAYNQVKGDLKYSSLPSVRSSDDALAALARWEEEHPEECCRLRDDGQFFGFTEVGNGYLGRHTRFIHVPAVRDALGDATEGKGSCVTEIMDLVVRRTLADRQDLLDFRTNTQDTYRELMDPTRLMELTTLQTQLCVTLQSYCPDGRVGLSWAALGEVDIPLPKAQVKLSEDGYECSVDRTGHGLQRAFILTMLQHLVAAKAAEEGAPERLVPGATPESTEEPEPCLPALVLAIEEPELYQHPSRQRHMASVLMRLSEGLVPGVASVTQVLYSTHSPLFVGLDRFDQLRLLRKADGMAGKPRVTRVSAADLDAVAEEIWRATGAQGDRYTAATLRPRLQAVMTPWVNEGFFADIAVLVEGEDDRAAILGVASLRGRDFDGEGIAIIPCIGKNNLDRPLVIFRRLGIPVYVIWDGDRGGKDAKPEANRRLLRLLGQEEQDWPCAVEDNCACFETDLTKTFVGEIGGELFDALISQCQDEFGIGGKEEALKNPQVWRRLVDLASEQDKTSNTLVSIVDRVVGLKARGASQS